jgi:hypothetical protein
MTDDKTEAGKTPLPHMWIKSAEGVAEVYANEVNLMWTLEDVRVRVGQLINSPETSNPLVFTPVVEERAAVTFPWRSAKLFNMQLAKLIERYESANGPIKTDLKLPSGENLA